MSKTVILRTASDILSETKKIAGLDPSIYQSGKFTASMNKISKRGSPFLN